MGDRFYREEPEPRDPEARRRRSMVTDQIVTRGVRDPRVIEAMEHVPRHEFVPDAVRGRAHADSPAPIGHLQTISQPFMVAAMTELLGVMPGDRVLEIGTGSGYQTAVLAEMGAEVWSVERVRPLSERAAQVLAELGYDEVHLRWGDGYAGWPEEAPFDRIVVTAAPPTLPEALVEQLAPEGRLVAPVGVDVQTLQVVTKSSSGETTTRDLFGVRFVPMVEQGATDGDEHGASHGEGPQNK